MIQHTCWKTAIFQLSPQNNHLKMVTVLHRNTAITFFSPENVTLEACYPFLSRKSNSTCFDTKCLLPDIFLAGMQIKFLKTSLYTEKLMLCLEEQITETLPLNKLRSPKEPLWTIISAVTAKKQQTNSFWRQSICWRSPKSFPVFKTKNSVGSLAFHNCSKQPTGEDQDR